MVGRGKRKFMAKRARMESQPSSESNSKELVNHATSPPQTLPHTDECAAKQKIHTTSEPIKISSSHQESIKKDVTKEDLNPSNVNREGGIVQGQVVIDRVDALDSSFKEMKEVVNNLQKIIVNHPPNVVDFNQQLLPIFNPMTHNFFEPFRCFNNTPSPFNASAMPLQLSSFTSPIRSPFTNPCATNIIMGKLNSPAHQPTYNGAPTPVLSSGMVNGTNHQPKTESGKRTSARVAKGSTTKSGSGRKLFTPNKSPTYTPRQLLTKSSPTGYYINYHSPSSRKLHAKKHGVDIPFWLPVLFRPPQHMQLDETDVWAASYIFGTDKDDEINGKEVLVKTSLCDGYRATLKTLMPKQSVDQDVLNLLVSMLTHNERSSSKFQGHWYLPTTFAQLGLAWMTPPKSMREFYQEDFMGKVECLCKIFVPVNEDNIHWYLVVVDMEKHRIILLDSKPSPSKKESKKFNIKKLAVYLEEMLRHDSFYNFEMTFKPKVSEFGIVEAEGIGEQKADSNDCGVWVATWMLECNWCDNYSIYVSDATRMRLALDLVLKPHNLIGKDVINSAEINYKKYEEKQSRLVKK